MSRDGETSAKLLELRQRIEALEKELAATQRVYIGVDLGMEDRTTIAFVQDRTLSHIYEGEQAMRILEAIDKAINQPT